MSLLVGFVTACGSSPSGTVGPCEGEDPPPECGAECTGDGDCAAGFHCSDASTCTAECTSGSESCPGGETCDDNGSCVSVDVDGGGNNGCPGVDVDLAARVPAVYFLIDLSSSMTEAFGGTDRWNGVIAALTGADGVVPALQDRVIFGATLYHNDKEGVCPDLEAVSASLTNVDAIAGLLADNEPDGDTPTGESIQATIEAIDADPPPAGSPKVIILATDGEPDTCAEPNPQNGQPESIAAAQAAFADGIDLYVLSVGTGPGTASEGHLQDVANAGAGLPIGGATNAPFYVATDTATLISQLTALITGAGTCEINIDGEVDLNRADEGIVVLNGVELAYGTDWNMVDPHTLVLIGDTCDQFLDTPDGELSAQFPCGGVIIP